MASTARSEFLRILREIKGEQLAALFVTAGKWLIISVTLYLLCEPAISAHVAQQRVITEKFKAGEWLPKYVATPPVAQEPAE